MYARSSKQAYGLITLLCHQNPDAGAKALDLRQNSVRKNCQFSEFSKCTLQ
jgi:hypothetical protein